MSELLHSSTDITLEEYLEGEKVAKVRHEFIAGRVYAMAGATDAHGRIALNAGSALDEALHSGSCRTFVSDMKVRIRHLAGDSMYYPDVLVTCDPNDAKNELHKEHPDTIIEVLSNSTEATDRREKFGAYQLLPSLNNYVLISQKKYEVTLFRRENGWKAEIIRNPEASLRLASLKLEIPLARLYRNVDFKTADPLTDLELYPPESFNH